MAALRNRRRRVTEEAAIIVARRPRENYLNTLRRNLLKQREREQKWHRLHQWPRNAASLSRVNARQARRKSRRNQRRRLAVMTDGAMCVASSSSGISYGSLAGGNAGGRRRRKMARHGAQRARLMGNSAATK